MPPLHAAWRGKCMHRTRWLATRSVVISHTNRRNQERTFESQTHLCHRHCRPRAHIPGCACSCPGACECAKGHSRNVICAEIRRPNGRINQARSSARLRCVEGSSRIRCARRCGSQCRLDGSRRCRTYRRCSNRRCSRTAHRCRRSGSRSLRSLLLHSVAERRSGFTEEVPEKTQMAQR